MREILGRPKWLATGAIFALFVAPTFISYQPYVFRWDDSEYLRRAVAVSRAFWSLNVHGMGAAMISMRPPVMTLLGLPWGPLASWEAAGKCFLSLAALISLLVAICLYLLLRVGVKPLYLVLAGLCVVASLGPHVGGGGTHGDATAFMADTLFAWTTLAALLLIPYEAKVYYPSIRSAVLRGFLWAAVFSLGLITKVSFLYFIVLVVPILFLIRRRCVGMRGTLAAFVAFACFSIPCAIYQLRWGALAFRNARASSFGRVADLYNVSLANFLVETIRLSPGLALSCCLMVIALVYVFIRRQGNVLGPEFLALLVMIGFSLLVLNSSNRQIRYSFPAIVALPILIGLLISAGGESVPGRHAALIAGLVFCGLLATGVPTRHRADRQSISRCNKILAQAAKCSARRIMLATDSPTLNKDLMDLAAEFWAPGPPVEVGTLAYQAMSGAPLEEDFHAIGESDSVVFQDRNKLSPPFANQRVPEYERYMRLHGHVPVRLGDDLSVYLMRCPSLPSEAQNLDK